MFGALGKALKAPLKAAGKLPGMGAVSGAVNKAPGMGAIGGALGIGPSPQAQQNGLGGAMGRVAQAASSFAPPGGMQRPQPMQSAPPMGAANMLSLGARNPQDTPEQGMVGQMQSPDVMGSMPQPMNPSPDNPAAMMAQRKMQMGGRGIGPSFGRGNRQM